MEASSHVPIAGRIRGKLDILVKLMGNNVVEISELLQGMERIQDNTLIQNENLKTVISNQADTISELKEEIVKHKQEVKRLTELPQVDTEEEKD